jgi:two-component system response regulator PilR (NtrC family)
MIHGSGPRAEGPFVPVNCGAIPSELMESEFFGHKRGSFTGAVSDKTGLMQSAEGGTLFLDEVADLPLHMQVKLLRVIQEKTVRPIGEQRVPRGFVLPHQRDRDPRAAAA